MLGLQKVDRHANYLYFYLKVVSHALGAGYVAARNIATTPVHHAAGMV